MFLDRTDAGRKLAEKLAPEYMDTDAVVLAIPRGGVVVADEVARMLHLKLDVVIPRKIGAPGNPELAIGAIAKDKPMLNEMLVRELNVSPDYIDEEIKRQLAEIERRKKLYLGGREHEQLEGKVALIVDDGLATGYTAKAAIIAVRQENPSKIVLAVPVAPADTVTRIGGMVDEVVVLDAQEVFFAVGQFYREFEQTTDTEVIEILKEYE